MSTPINTPKLFDTVELLTDFPEKKLKKGNIGTIFGTYDDTFYGIYFSGDRGECVANSLLEYSSPKAVGI